MTALAEALLAAQRQAVATLGKASVAGAIEDEEVVERLRKIGCNEAIDLAHLLATWDLLREFGAQLAPNGAGPRPAALDEPATKAQLDYLAKLADDKGRVVNTDGMTKAQATQAIDALKRDAEIPF